MPQSEIILLAEDDEDYVFLIKKAFDHAEIPVALHAVGDGQEAMWYLQGEGKYANRDEYPLPDIFLLDLRLPRYSGFEVLSWLRNQPGLSALRVLVLTSSDRLNDVNEAYRLGANTFMVKPRDFVDLARLTKMIHDFWIGASQAPQSSRPPKKAEIETSQTVPKGQVEKSGSDCP